MVGFELIPSHINRFLYVQKTIEIRSFTSQKMKIFFLSYSLGKDYEITYEISTPGDGLHVERI